jgi:hypothetical protein
MDRFSGTKVYLLGLNTREGVAELVNEKVDIKVGQRW